MTKFAWESVDFRVEVITNLNSGTFFAEIIMTTAMAPAAAQQGSPFSVADTYIPFLSSQALPDGSVEDNVRFLVSMFVSSVNDQLVQQHDLSNLAKFESWWDGLSAGEQRSVYDRYRQAYIAQGEAGI